jgi:Family of unknown function (DUF5706)
MNIIEPTAHVDQMLRQSRQQNLQLNAMADIKANILLTVSALMLTFCIPFLGKQALQWPAVIMILFCALTALASILVLMPSLPPSTRVARKSANYNLLFFGTYADMDHEEYVTEMEALCNDPKLAYEAIVRDMYQSGQFLAHKKFRYLRLGYQLFLYGIFASILAFAVVEIMAMQGVHVWTFGIEEHGVISVAPPVVVAE